MLRTVLVLSIFASTAQAQFPTFSPTPHDTAKVLPARPPQRVELLEGPRIGLTVATGEIARIMKDELGVAPLIVQFGWQKESRLFRLENGMEGLTEHVLLLGGVEQGAFLPSYTAMIGLRTRSGKEFGVGPNLSIAGAAYAFTAGTTIRTGPANIPFNVALVPSGKGVRLSVLTGFNVQR